jgi:hypothetical protein
LGICRRLLRERETLPAGAATKLAPHQADGRAPAIPKQGGGAMSKSTTYRGIKYTILGRALGLARRHAD